MEREERQPAKRGITEEERRAAERAQLYRTHKAHGTLGMYFWFYPDEAPAPRPVPREREEQGRER